ncbi:MULTISPECIES: aminoglycoside phosphotransferase family protein [unclassified Bradyrhizobium]
MNRAEPQADENLLALATSLAESAGKGQVCALSRLAGGKNNQVYRVETEGGASLVLKRYFTDPRDPRDRLRAEWEFLQHAWARGIRCVPQPLACDAAVHAGLYSFVEGRKLLASELQPAHIAAAIDFVLAMNAKPRAELAPGSEACFTLAEHIATVERRVERLARLDPEAPHAKEARTFVATRLLPTWHAVQSDLSAHAQRAGISMDQALAPDDCCLSPSDFGFHNALADDTGRVTFLDFEYAGRDDPAKLVSDFFCQPEIPVPLDYHATFVARVADGFGLDEKGCARCRMLLDVYRVKWTCIILNDFLPLGAARRAFADAGAWAARCAGQLAKAKAKLAALHA